MIKAEELYGRLISGEIQPSGLPDTLLSGPDRKEVVSAFTGILCELLLRSGGDQGRYNGILDGLMDRGISPFEEDALGHCPASYAYKFSVPHLLEFFNKRANYLQEMYCKDFRIPDLCRKIRRSEIELQDLLRTSYKYGSLLKIRDPETAYSLFRLLGQAEVSHRNVFTNWVKRYDPENRAVMGSADPNDPCQKELIRIIGFSAVGEKVRNYLEKGAYANCLHPNGSTLLQHALDQEKFENALCLLEFGAAFQRNSLTQREKNRWPEEILEIWRLRKEEYQGLSDEFVAAASLGNIPLVQDYLNRSEGLELFAAYNLDELVGLCLHCPEEIIDYILTACSKVLDDADVSLTDWCLETGSESELEEDLEPEEAASSSIPEDDLGFEDPDIDSPDRKDLRSEGVETPDPSFGGAEHGGFGNSHEEMQRLSTLKREFSSQILSKVQVPSGLRDLLRPIVLGVQEWPLSDDVYEEFDSLFFAVSVDSYLEEKEIQDSASFQDQIDQLKGWLPLFIAIKLFCLKKLLGEI